MRREIKKWQEFIQRVRRVDLPLSWKMSWLCVLIANYTMIIPKKLLTAHIGHYYWQRC
jgi:hypothetical protein